MQQTNDADVVDLPRSRWRELWTTEDWLANLIGGLLLVTFISVIALGWINDEKALKGLFPKPGAWTENPVEGLSSSTLLGLARVFIGSVAVFGAGIVLMGGSVGRFALGFVGVFALAVLSYILSQQKLIAAYNIEYALWAIVLGMAISNTVGTPQWIKPALRTEFFIKTGLVIYGAEIILGLLLKLAVPGILVSWVVTPIVLISTYLIGQRWIKMESKTLNIVISADMSVCGVSAAIATAAACRAKKEELSLAIGISLAFTAIMMVLMPWFIRAVGLDPVVGGAWIGGTIDSTGAVGAAGQVLGDTGRFMAITIKMIQNMLIGVIAFGVAVYWASFIDRGNGPAVGPSEIWKRFPKFILGFVAASIAFTWMGAQGGVWGESAMLAKDTLVKAARDWFFCLAFVSIGLETDFRQLSHHLRGGKPVMLYVIGQSINLALSLAMCWLVFRVIYPDFAASLAGQ